MFEAKRSAGWAIPIAAGLGAIGLVAWLAWPRPEPPAEAEAPRGPPPDAKTVKAALKGALKAQHGDLVDVDCEPLPCVAVVTGPRDPQWHVRVIDSLEKRGAPVYGMGELQALDAKDQPFVLAVAFPGGALSPDEAAPVRARMDASLGRVVTVLETPKLGF